MTRHFSKDRNEDSSYERMHDLGQHLWLAFVSSCSFRLGGTASLSIGTVVLRFSWLTRGVIESTVTSEAFCSVVLGSLSTGGLEMGSLSELDSTDASVCSTDSPSMFDKRFNSSYHSSSEDE